MIKHGIERQTGGCCHSHAGSGFVAGRIFHLHELCGDGPQLAETGQPDRPPAGFLQRISGFSGNQSLLQQQVDIAASHRDIRSVVVRDANLRNLAVAGNLNNTNERVLFENPMPVSDNPVVFHEDHNFLWLYQPIRRHRYSWMNSTMTGQ